MTDRRSREERERAPDKRGRAAPAPAPRSHPTPEDTVLDLQGLAGNRAVADFLGGHEAPLASESHGLRVRDLLRSGRRPAQPAVQRQDVDPETGKEAWEEKGTGPAEKAWEEKGTGRAAKAWEEKGTGPAAKAWEEKGTGRAEKAWEEKGTGPAEKAWEEKGTGPAEKAWEEKGTGPAAASQMLATGSSGPAVVRLQQLLVAAGFAVSADGVFGPRTRAAVIAFQAGRGLAADGIVGPKTWGALQGSTPASAGAGPAGLAATGEMELVAAGSAMEKAGSGGGGAGEATLPEAAAGKEGGMPEAKLPEAEPWDLKEST